MLLGMTTASQAAVCPRAEKNLYVLRDILERIPGARLAFVGDGPERESLEKHFAGTRTVFMVRDASQLLLERQATTFDASSLSSVRGCS